MQLAHNHKIVTKAIIKSDVLISTQPTGMFAAPMKCGLSSVCKHLPALPSVSAFKLSCEIAPPIGMVGKLCLKMASKNNKYY